MTTPTNYPMKRRSPWGAWLITLVTLGIYFFVWYYKIHRELLDRFPDHDIRPTGSLLTMIFGSLIIIPPFVSIARTGGRIADAERAVGKRVTSSGGLGLLLWIIFNFAIPYYQTKLNAIIDADLRSANDHERPTTTAGS